MSSFFKKALSLFVVIDENESAGPTAESVQNPSSGEASATTSTPSAKAPVAAGNVDLTKFEKHFESLFENTNLPGPDYFEFWKMMETLEAPIPDEKMRMQAVFASLKIQGLSKQVLIDTAMQYKKAVDDDRKNFEAAVQQKFDVEVKSRVDEIEKLQKEADAKRKQIEQLQKELENGIARTNTLQQEIEAEKARIASTQDGYLMACNAMSAKIESDIKVFQQILA